MENFSIPVNLAGVRAYTVGEGAIPTGVYTAQITDVTIVPAKDGKVGRNLQITHKITGGHIKAGGTEVKQVPIGREFRQWCGIPGYGAVNGKGESNDPHFLGRIRAILESIGYSPAQLDQPFNLEASHIANQVVRVYIIERTASDDGSTDYITPAKYDLYTKGEWKPAEATGKAPNGRGGIAVGGALAGVAAIGAGGPSGASFTGGMGGGIGGGMTQGGVMAGSANPLAGGGMGPAAGTPNPAFGAGGMGAPTPIGPIGGLGAPNGLGGLVR